MELYVEPHLVHKSDSLPPLVKRQPTQQIKIHNKFCHSIYDQVACYFTRKRRSISAARTLWPLPVPYSLYLSLDMNAQGVILKAFEQFRLKTCIDFRPQQFWFEQHIALKWGIGCWSEVGRQPSLAQDLSIGPNCDTVATVEHELMHALGFWHEQSRYDRDNYVSINWENIKAGEENNFEVGTNDTNSTMSTPYDYLSIMHYPKDAFTNGNGSTIITKLPEFQDVIGQRLDMSHYDIEELNRMYECNESISFLDHFSFDEGMREMSSAGWQRVSRADGGPHSDHTYLGTDSQGTGFFMHFSTKRGSVGDSARLQTRRMTPRRSCKIQCLEFFYYHSGSWSDQLNIWIREFDGVDDTEGTRRFMGQIKGIFAFNPTTQCHFNFCSPADYWKLHHVPLDATKTFQVEFEARKGAGSSSGGFSVDDINLSETECPHQTWQIRNFEEKLNTSPNNSFLLSPKYYSIDGYRYQLMVRLNKDYFGVFVRLVSGINDDWLQWPCPWRQVTFTLLDQNPHIQKRMSQQRSVTTSTALSLREFFGNPRIWGSPEDFYFWTSYVNNGRGYGLFMPAAKLTSREFLKGGDIFFLITMQDISSLVHEDTLPCPSIAVKTWHEDAPTTTSSSTVTTSAKPHNFPTPGWPKMTPPDRPTTINFKLVILVISLFVGFMSVMCKACSSRQVQEVQVPV
ncbi:meprin A subunit beta-like [Clupea harengus]|uniref:Meprin A subunit beta-like n=1 Tax=Clupea harengus TaxID=7950 RepID=A0A8M1KMH9_CLUHA|nr:meprin A subunit beta-like [Clupea harengus]